MFHIRPASLARGDDKLLGELWESQFEWLIANGSAQQFGNKLYRQRWPDTDNANRETVRESESGVDKPFGIDWCRVFVAEAIDDEERSEKSNLQQGGPQSPVVAAAVVLKGKCDDEDARLPEQDMEDPFIIMDYLMSNRHAGTASKGAAVELMNYAKEQALKVGVHRLCVICFRGNDRKLVKYYEKHGFTVLSEFVNTELQDDLSNWPGAVLETRF